MDVQNHYFVNHARIVPNGEPFLDQKIFGFREWPELFKKAYAGSV